MVNADVTIIIIAYIIPDLSSTGRTKPFFKVQKGEGKIKMTMHCRIAASFAKMTKIINL